MFIWTYYVRTLPTMIWWWFKEGWNFGTFLLFSNTRACWVLTSSSDMIPFSLFKFWICEQKTKQFSFQIILLFTEINQYTIHNEENISNTFSHTSFSAFLSFSLICSTKFSGGGIVFLLLTRFSLFSLFFSSGSH